MTAEIGLLNKHGIALAADSAVTIGGGIGYYNTVNKLFSLSKYEPVAVMIYSNASLMGYPLEILIKEYRKKLGKKSFCYLNEYWDDFVGYLKEFFYSDGNNINYKKYYYREVLSVLESINDKINTEIKSLPSDIDPQSSEFKERIISIIENQIIEIYDNFKAFDDDIIYEKKESAIRSECEDDIIKLINDFFGVELQEETIRKLVDISIMILTKNHGQGNYTGIVISGYGEKDIYPKLISGNFYGAYFDDLKYSIVDDVSISDENRAAIMPFAQKDVVETFLNGYDINLIVDLLQTISENDNNGEIVDKAIDTVKKKSNEYHKKAINTTVSVAPKEELAHMAETLVNLTSFRRKLALDDYSQTVGGPIDVALITKGDGLVWIKRKLYFDKELNYNFYNNYFRERIDYEYSCNKE